MPLFPMSLFISGTISQVRDRSRMNAPLRIQGGNQELEKKFVEEAQASGMVQLKGHR